MSRNSTDSKKAKVITVCNNKGGCGKSSTAAAIASILRSMGYSTLIVDADAQGNTSDTYQAKIHGQATLYDVILDHDDPCPIMEAIQHTENGDIIASDPLLKQADMDFLHDDKGHYYESEYKRLDNAFQGLMGYDYVIIDTAPADNILLRCCLSAGSENDNYVVIPITADRYSVQGLSELSKTIMAEKQQRNPNLKIAGFLLTRFKRNQVLASEVKTALDGIADQMHTKVFKTYIRECVSVQKSQATRVSLIRYDKNCNASKDYIAFVKELLEDIG